VNARKPNNTQAIGPKSVAQPETASDTSPENDSSLDSNESRTPPTSGSSATVANNQTVQSVLASSSPITAVGPASYCGGRNAAGLHWPPTPLNRRHEQPCPGNSVGQARWQCTADGWQPEMPNLSACRSSRLRSLRQQLTTSIDRTTSMHMFTELLDVVRSGELFSNDLPTTLWIGRQLLLQSGPTVVNHFSALATDAEITRRPLKLTVDLVSELLDERRRPPLPSRLAPHVFGERLLLLLQTAVGQLTATLNQDGSTNLEADNVLLTLHILDPEMPITLLFPTSEDIRDVRWMQLQDSVYLPARALNDFASNRKLVFPSSSTQLYTQLFKSD
jgi:hypothetical protein